MPKKVRKKTKRELSSRKFRERSKQKAAILAESYRAAGKLSKKRNQFILNIADNNWAQRLEDPDDHEAYERENRKWTKERKLFLREATRPLELHWFTCNWNAGRGLKPLLSIVKNEFCDAGTCSRLYWINDPYYYQEYSTIGECNYEEERNMLHILRTIERRFMRADFKSRKIPFDPTPWIEDKYRESAIHKMPDVMLEYVGKKRRSS